MTASLKSLHWAAVGLTLRMCAADAGPDPGALLDSRGFLTVTDSRSIHAGRHGRDPPGR